MKQFKLKSAVGAVLVASSLLTAPLTVKASGIPVVDGAAAAQRAANFIKEMQEMANQLATMKNQYEQQVKQFKSMTGSRGLGNILKDTVKDHVPSEWSAIYGDIKNADYKSVIHGKSYDTNISDRTLAKNYQDIQEVFNSNKQQLSNLENLMNQINNTQDMKAAADLQNRIAVERAKIANNQTKLDMLDRLYARQQEVNSRNYAIREACMARNMATKNYSACK
ncbi:MAG: type IV secretion system protein [Neisseria sp.]|nr:type IV secretion system protein [Neisseria sp.]